MANKAALTPQERIKAAHAHYVLGVEQTAIAMMFEVNIGRVNEACTAVAGAVGIETPADRKEDRRSPRLPLEKGGKR